MYGSYIVQIFKQKFRNKNISLTLENISLTSIIGSDFFNISKLSVLKFLKVTHTMLQETYVVEYVI